MSNMIVVQGFVNNLKKYSNKDGSMTLLFTISSKTNDYKRISEQNNNRDYFSINLFIPSSRVKLADYINDGTVLSVGGVPYQSIDENDTNKRYFNIKGFIDMISFIPTANGNQQQQTQQTQQHPQQQPQQQQQPPQQGGGFQQPNAAAGQSW